MSQHLSFLTMARLHEGLRPLAWLLGEWESIQAKGMYPTSASFDYTTTLKITHLGQPVLNFYSESWLGGIAKHVECGFIRMDPATKKVAYMCAQDLGFVEIEEGELKGTSIEFKDDLLLSMSLPNTPSTTGLRRAFCLKPGGILEQIVLMSTPKTPFAQHLYITYKNKGTSHL
ncbi:THAP domain-containing protein 4-like isoform X2 [Acanthaster planci]|uniref:THAP domain-containing protein 4-like isoform X2 n=1 Tax=Acanthaster planci TaxID=133434 RepID=A0A8B7YPD0_ACAPL|nr:THAP domain-containing protein 4-like isoform X2 [Acanthaster planci]